MTSRRWCITDNTIAEDFSTQEWQDKLPGTCNYAVWQKEKAASGKVHIQAFLKLSKPMRMAGLKKCFGNVHCEMTRGTDEQAMMYCKKEESRVEGPFEFGTLTRQGQRRELEEVADDFSKRMRLDEVALKHPATFIKFHGGFKELAQVHARQDAMRFRDPKVTVIYGETGSGKTSSILKTETDLMETYILDKDGEGSTWWDGYQGQKRLLLDDFYGNIKASTMLRLLDRYPVRLGVKNSHTYANWDEIFVTSNVHPRMWYNSGAVPEEVLAGIKRRIHKIYKCDVGILQEVDWDEYTVN